MEFNPLLKTLNFGLYWDFIEDSSFQTVFQHMKNLKSITTHHQFFASEILKHELSLQALDITCIMTDETLTRIGKNFKYLQCLTIRDEDDCEYSGKGLNVIWSMPKLVSFAYEGWVDKETWLGSFTSPNTSIKSLSIQGTMVEDEVMIACIKNFPNITNLEILDV